MSKKLLQITLAILGLIPILTGGLTIIFGAHELEISGVSLSSSTTGYVVLDSEMRFLGAVWLGIGIMVYTTIPRIERQTVLFRLIMTAIILGGIGRLLSAVFVGKPPLLYIALIVLELVGMPLLLFWQSRISSDSAIAENP